MWRANEPSSGAASGASASVAAGATTTTAVAAAITATPTPPAPQPPATALASSRNVAAPAATAMWRFDTTSSAAGSSSSSTTNTTTANNHGVIGSGNVHAASRFLWSRMAPEEEEREEEALPSYLSYLQPAFQPTAMMASSKPTANDANHFAATTSPFDSSLRRQSLPTASLSHAASALPFVPAAHKPHQNHQYATQAYSTTTNYEPLDHASGHVATKSREFATALQEFVLSQIAQQVRKPQQPPGLGVAPLSGTSSGATCNCEPLKSRVSELEMQLQTLQQQVTSLLQRGMGNTVVAPLLVSSGATTASGGCTTSAGLSNSGATNTASSGATKPPALAMSGALQQQPPPPLPPQSPPQSTTTTTTTTQLPVGGVGSAMSDRVSTLEGRQSAFQSQLAQIAKVLGVPTGKHGKHSHVKTLVQTLRDDIDVKVLAATTELETKCVERVNEQLATTVEQTTKREIELQLTAHRKDESTPTGSLSSPAPPPSGLTYETVLSALAEEHEASLTKLSAYFDERLVIESKQRVALESRFDARCSEFEEWLQQLEGEFGSWHDASSSVAAQIRTLQLRVADVETTNRNDADKWTKLQAAGTSGASDKNYQTSSNGSSSATKTRPKSASGATQTASTTPAPPTTDALARTVQQLTTQFKHLQAEVTSDVATLRETTALLEPIVQTTRVEGRATAKTTKGLKQLVEKLVRDTGAAEELLQQYVGTITHQVASVTRQYVSVRIRDNNRLIDATLRARVPAYVANESESFMLVRPEKLGGATSGAVVVKDDDDDAIRQLLESQMQHGESRSGGDATTTVSTTAPAPLSPVAK